ncbi:hypothetical protein BH20ACI1_BH20ACI1_15620 [soil metagenome]
MRFIKLSLVIITITMFIAACSSSQTDDVSYTNPDQNEIIAENEIVADENPYLASENLDLQRVGSLLEESDNAEDFEYRLNSDNGINNLDLNGDGYADYLSVSEYDNRYDNQRGFTIFDKFGPDEIQEIARIILDRNSYDDPGARVLLTGNEQIYGDDYNYETNWLDKSLAIANWAFGNRDDYYQSPYYYDNYPDNYETYRVVETPVYRTRVEEYYPEPIFVQTVNPTITQIRINSQYKDKSADKIYAKLAKPTKEQKEFRENNPNLPEFIPIKRGKNKNFSSKRNDKAEKSRKSFDKYEKQNDKKFEMRNKDKWNKPNKIERENIKPDKPNKVKQEKFNPNKPDKADKKGDKGNAKGNGGGKGNGKGNGGKKGKN